MFALMLLPERTTRNPVKNQVAITVDNSCISFPLANRPRTMQTICNFPWQEINFFLSNNLRGICLYLDSLNARATLIFPDKSQLLLQIKCCVQLYPIRGIQHRQKQKESCFVQEMQRFNGGESNIAYFTLGWELGQKVVFPWGQFLPMFFFQRERSVALCSLKTRHETRKESVKYAKVSRDHWMSFHIRDSCHAFLPNICTLRTPGIPNKLNLPMPAVFVQPLLVVRIINHKIKFISTFAYTAGGGPAQSVCRSVVLNPIYT